MSISTACCSTKIDMFATIEKTVIKFAMIVIARKRPSNSVHNGFIVYINSMTEEMHFIFIEDRPHVNRRITGCQIIDDALDLVDWE